MAAVKGNGASSEALLERLEELADKCASRFTPVFTKFLDDREALIAKQLLKRYGDDVRTVFYGGFDGAERCAAGLFPAMLYAQSEFSDKELCELFELCFIRISGSGYRKFTHRDFLGSVLSLGVKRETVGDIVVDADKTGAYAAFTRPAGELVLRELCFVANDKVKLEAVSASELPAVSTEYRVVAGTVASFRLDCVLALALNTSREKAKQLISSKCVSVNHAEACKCDAELCEGDLLSVRGSGRYKLAQLGDATRKGRNRITIHKLV